MKLNNFIMGTYEIETLSAHNICQIMRLMYQKGVQYLDTSISYNNDWLIGECNLDFKIISKFPPQFTEKYDEVMEAHLSNLCRDKIDIMLIHNSRADWVELADRLESDSRIGGVGVSNFNVQQLVEYKDKIGEYPKYNEIEINPNYVDLKTVDFCKTVGIKVIGYAIFGGKYKAVRTISDYTLSTLLSTIQHIADMAILRVDSEDQLKQVLSAEETEFYWNPLLKLTQEKSIEPMIYKPTAYSQVYYDKTPMATYSKYLGSRLKFLPKQQGDSEFLGVDLTDYINNYPYLEFITDYRAAVRYKVEELLKLYPKSLVRYEANGHSDILGVLVNKGGHYDHYVIGVYLIKDGSLTKINELNSNTEKIVKVLKVDC